MSCKHPLPEEEEEVEITVQRTKDYGKYADSVGSVRLHIEYVCPTCGSEIEGTTDVDLRDYEISEL